MPAWPIFLTMIRSSEYYAVDEIECGIPDSVVLQLNL
jgi:hypothetical protein